MCLKDFWFLNLYRVFGSCNLCLGGGTCVFLDPGKGVSGRAPINLEASQVFGSHPDNMDLALLKVRTTHCYDAQWKKQEIIDDQDFVGG